MAERETIKTELKNGVALVLLQVPVEHDTAGQLRSAIDSQLEQGTTRFVMDFTPARLIPSPVVATILELAEKIVDDHHGKLVVSGLSDLNRRVFEMVGIFLFAEEAPSVGEAEAKVRL